MAYPVSINVAIAVAMEDGGLITPVLAAADRTDLYSLSRSWADLVERARAKQLKPDEYSTGTFTLSNLGMFGVDRFDAILPPGTGAILAVAASRPTVVAGKDGSISVKRQMQVNLTCDRRSFPQGPGSPDRDQSGKLGALSWPAWRPPFWRLPFWRPEFQRVASGSRTRIREAPEQRLPSGQPIPRP
jgi:hypothetical protein